MADPTDSTEIHRAHPQRVALFCALAAGGFVFGYAFDLWLGGLTSAIADLAGEDPEAAMRELGTLLNRIGAAIAVSSLIGAALVRRYGNSVTAERRFPTRATVTLSDMPVLRGSEAEARGRALQGIAVFVAASGIALAWFLTSMLSNYLA